MQWPHIACHGRQNTQQHNTTQRNKPQHYTTPAFLTTLSFSHSAPNSPHCSLHPSPIASLASTLHSSTCVTIASVPPHFSASSSVFFPAFISLAMMGLATFSISLSFASNSSLVASWLASAHLVVTPS